MTFRETLRALARWRRTRGAAGVSFVLGLGLLFVPHFNELGFEAALATAAVVPIAAGLVAAGVRRLPGAIDRPGTLLAALLATAGILVGLPLLMLSLFLVAAPVCDPVQGLIFFALLPLCSALLAAVVGWFLALLATTSRRATGAWLAVIAASLGLVVYRFFATPAVSFFGPFFGQYPGVLYDTWIPVSGRLLTYRATNLAEAALLLALVRWGWDPVARRVSLRRLVRARAAALTVPPLLGVCGLAWALGPELGHRTDTAHLAARLGAHAAGRSCDVYGPADTPAEELRLVAEDCDFRVRQIRRFAGLPDGGERVTVLLFRSEEEKAAGMGAGRTSVAKPWRREVYVHEPGFPHRVLKHELAHVILGELCDGPFRVPARWGGLLPLPGLVEGGAVAAEWPVDELTPHGWAAAMDRLGLLPPATTLLGIGFLGENAGTAYLAMGSFVRWLRDTHGPAAFRRAYRNGDFAAACGRSLEALWSEWRAWLARIPLDEARMEVARARFDAPGFFAMRCPHAVAEAAARRDARLARGDAVGALEAQEDACRLSGGDPDQRLARLALAVQIGQAAEADALARSLLADWTLGRRRHDLVRVLQADAAWQAGRVAAARSAYEEVLPRVPRAPERRLLQVKLHLLARPALSALLRDDLLQFGRPGRSPEFAEAAWRARLEEAAQQAPGDAVVGYLLGRALYNDREFGPAEQRLRAAVASGGLPVELRLEALALLVNLEYRRGAWEDAARDAGTLAAAESEEYRALGEDWRERIDWRRARGGSGGVGVDPRAEDALDAVASAREEVVLVRQQLDRGARLRGPGLQRLDGTEVVAGSGDDAEAGGEEAGGEGRKTGHRQRGRDQPEGEEVLAERGGPGGDERAERVADEGEAGAGGVAGEEAEGRRHVLDLGMAPAVPAARGAGAAEVEAEHRGAAGGERPADPVDGRAVQVAAHLRMGVTHHDGQRGVGRVGQAALEFEGVAGNADSLLHGGPPPARLLAAFLRLAVRQRVGAIVDIHQMIERHLGVALGGGEAGVSEEFLDRAQVGAPVEEVGGVGVAQGVGTGAERQDAARSALDETLDGAHPDARSAAADEQRMLSTVAGGLAGAREDGGTHRKVRLDRGDGLAPQRHEAVLVALAVDAERHRTVGTFERLVVEVDELGDAQPGAVQHLEDCVVADRERVVFLVGAVEDGEHVVDGQHPRQLARLLRAPDRLHRIVVGRVHPGDDAEEGSEGGDLAADRGRVELPAVQEAEVAPDDEHADVPHVDDALAGREFEQVGDVADVGRDGVGRAAPLAREELLECTQPRAELLWKCRRVAFTRFHGTSLYHIAPG